MCLQDSDEDMLADETRPRIPVAPSMDSDVEEAKDDEDEDEIEDEYQYDDDFEVLFLCSLRLCL